MNFHSPLIKFSKNSIIKGSNKEFSLDNNAPIENIITMVKQKARLLKNPNPITVNKIVDKIKKVASKSARPEMYATVELLMGQTQKSTLAVLAMKIFLKMR